MSKGIRIAKPGYSVSSANQFLYVDTDTPLLKVHSYGSANFALDGTSKKAAWSGSGTGTTVDNISGYSVRLVVPHNLGYTPMFQAYMDFQNGGDRRYLTSISGGGNGINFASAITDAQELIITAQPQILSGQTYPLAGAYGIFYYIFKDRITPPDQVGKL